MEISLQSILPLLTSFGLGGLITLVIKSYLDNRNRRFEDEFSHKEKRYKAIMIQMWASINPDKEISHLQKFRPDITSNDMLFRELELELYNGTLYASDDVLKKLRKFIATKDYQSYLIVALAMRKDLYGKKSKIKFDDLRIESKNNP